MDAALLSLFIVTFTSILILPGPNVMFAVGQSLKYGFLGSIFVALGFMVSTGIQAILVLSGLGLLISKYSAILIFLKWVGVVYLVYLAYKVFTKKPSYAESKEKEMSKLKMFVTAMLFSLTNPKALMASALTYPVFISPAHAYEFQALALAVSAMVISFSIYGAYSLSASAFKRRIVKANVGNKIVGSLYLLAAGTLVSKSTE